MAWNRPSNEKVEKKGVGGQRNVHLRGLLAGAIVVVGAGIAAWLMWPTERRGEDATSTQRKSLIREVTPAAVPTNVVVESVKTNDVPPGFVRSSTGVLHPAGIPYKKEWKHAHSVHTNDPSRYARSKSTAPAPFRNATEQALHRLFSRPLGMAPLPPIRLSKEDLDDLVNVLVTPNRPTKDDDERSAAARKLIDLAKKEMAKFIADGGRPQEFLDHYWRENEKAYSLRREAMDQLEDFRNSEDDPELCEQFKAEVNKRLSEKGIIPINN